jgi:hypothetical protein
MAIPKLSNTSGSNSLLNRYTDLKQSMRREAFSIIGDTFDREFPGSRSLFSSSGFKRQSKFAKVVPQQPRPIQQGTSISPRWGLFLIHIAKSSSETVNLMKTLNKSVDKMYAELRVMNSLILRSTNLSKQNLDMMRTYARLRVEKEKESDFERQIDASKFVKVVPQQSGNQPHQQQKKDSFFGKLASFFAPLAKFASFIARLTGVFTVFKLFSGALKTLIPAMTGFGRVLAMLALVGLPVLIMGAVAARGMFGALDEIIVKARKGDKNYLKNGIAGFVGGDISETKNGIEDLEIMKTFKKNLTEHMVNNQDFYKPFIKTIGGLFGVIWEPLTFGFKSFFKDTFFKEEDRVEMFNKFKEDFMYSLELALMGGDELGFDKIQEEFRNIGKRIKDKSLEILDTTLSIFTDIKNSVVETFSTIYNSVKSFHERIFSFLFPKSELGLKNKFTEDFMSLSDPVKGSFTKTLGESFKTRADLKNKFTEDFLSLSGTVKEPLNKTLVESSSKDMARAANMMTLQNNINNHDFLNKFKHPIQQAPSNIVAPVSNNVNTNNYVATMASTRNPNAQQIIKDHVAQ